MSPVRVRVAVAATPFESAMLAGLKAAVSPVTFEIPSASKLTVPLKSSGVAVKLKMAWPTGFKVSEVAPISTQ